MDRAKKVGGQLLTTHALNGPKLHVVTRPSQVAAVTLQHLGKSGGGYMVKTCMKLHALGLRGVHGCKPTVRAPGFQPANPSLLPPQQGRHVTTSAAAVLGQTFN